MTTTVNDILTAARHMARDPNGSDLTESLGLSIINNLLALIHQTLINAQSDLIRGSVQVTTVDGTAEYTLQSGGDDLETAGILPQGIWKDGYPGNPLTRKIKSELVAAGYDLSDEAEPSYWYPVDLNTIGFCLTPDDAYTYNVFYWQALTAVTKGSSSIPFNGFFDQVLKYWAAIEYLTTIGEDIQHLAIQLKNAWGTAMQYVYEYGCTRWRASGDMFDVDGV